MPGPRSKALTWWARVILLTPRGKHICASTCSRLSQGYSNSKTKTCRPPCPVSSRTHAPCALCSLLKLAAFTSRAGKCAKFTIYCSRRILILPRASARRWQRLATLRPMAARFWACQRAIYWKLCWKKRRTPIWCLPTFGRRGFRCLAPNLALTRWKTALLIYLRRYSRWKLGCRLTRK